MKKPGSLIKKISPPAKKKSSAAASSRQQNKQSLKQFPIVAIGASAGGLEAMTELLKNLPPDTGMAFIYVQHLSPEHKSMLTEILSKATKMKVQEIDDMDKIKPDNVFVIPATKAIKVVDGHIKLIPRPANSSAISIDILFSSLAQQQKERVIAIILSGSASDGSRGIKDIKQEGGLIFAQDSTAKFAGMPQSAVATGAVDFILSPKEMAFELARLSKHPFVKTNGEKLRKEDLIENSNPDLQNILSHLQKTAGIDFNAYKMNTIKRRVIRRMVFHKIKTLREYEKLINEKKEETNLLYQDLLINVTSFFRDAEANKYLQTTLFPKMLNRKKNGESLRIWVPACSTGEEAFSIAMLLLELQDGKNAKVPVQIFATDINAQAISKARAGLFSKQDLETISPKRIQQFFIKNDIGYRISKSVREICVFAPHNILSDPPFSRLDFISCCNLFIYLDSPAQKRILNTFHYALNDDGYLMLGKSEAISSSTQLFTRENKKFKIFSRKKTGNRLPPAFSSPFTHYNAQQENFSADKTNNLRTSVTKTSFENNNLDSAINAVLLTEFTPVSVVINHAMEIVQFRGATDLYLAHPTGKATLNILKMARPEIALELRTAISKAIKTKHKVRKSGIEMKANAALRVISLEVVPLKIEWDEPLLLILFTEQEQVEIVRQTKGGKNTTAAKDRRIKKLEEELAMVQADALAFAQEQEAFTEELQSANEEVVSSNEELQTMNEELETSKEEIESVNEELRSTNEEMQTRNELLNEAYEYSEAIVATIRDPMLILNKDLRVKSANQTFYKNFGVKKENTEDVLVYDLGNGQWNIARLREFLEDIILKNTYMHNFEVAHNFPNIGNRIMLLNASRIIQKAHHEHLILLIIEDITEVRMKTEELQRKEKEMFTHEIEQQKEHSELLEKMNTELKAFSFIASHDLQEPLRKIQTLTARIIEKENQNLSDSGKDYFRRMQHAAKRMQILINDLLTFSRLSIEERVFTNTNPNSIIEEVKKELKEVIEDKNAIIEVKEVCEIKIIPFQFRQLMQNLIGNALKFSNPKIRPHIIIQSKKIPGNKIRIANISPDKEYCHISISDNGIGFEKEFSEKIFEVFQKLHSREEYEGTGIGLAIVKKIVENHNGLVTATSELGKGATFDIYIPA